ncbi:citrate synthase [Alicyclobacillus kakegawensis]|uniref:citrate synthase n=1 Tax=Alicyclobacillus kakegawensis TaxID=392012 RepID=UPI0008330396|nr:citrate synthase [Alicyclobacillus kakegawensis]
MAISEAYRPGLEGVIAAETGISYLDVEHEQIVVRGYDLIELANTKRYLDVVFLLWNRNLPTEEERERLEQTLAENLSLPDGVLDVLRSLPQRTHPMDALRTGLSALAGYDPLLDDRSAQANREKGARILARMPHLVANGYHILQGERPVMPAPDLSFSANFLYMITGRRPTALEEAVFDQSLIVYSEHEMPNSTFAARVISSTQSDIYGALTGAVASLKGSLHGGANEAVMRMLEQVQTADQLEQEMKRRLAQKERIMGFGHRVYMRRPDPRALLMKEALKKLVGESGNREILEICERGEAVMYQEKGLYPNLDYYAAPVYYLLGIPIPLYTPVFFAARTAGLVAHVMEQHDHNRLFRPRVHYTGPRGLRP